ncbi:MAG: tetratricopeptide repeat protein, partial [Thermoplasmata archaeon]|nr:tetratricopeptide repeat protein [Thermoplasmata archaeon]
NNIGNAYYNLDQWEKSIPYFEQGIDVCPDYEIAWNNIGNAYDKMGKHAEAQPYHDKALELKPDFDYALYAKGYGMAKLGDLEYGLEYIEQSLDLNPNYDHSWLAKANVLHWLGKPEEALESLNNSLLLNTYFDSAWERRGEIFKELGQYQKANYCFERALSIVNEILAMRPSHKDALKLATGLLETIKRYDQLGVCCTNIITSDNAEKQKLTKARLLLKMGNNQELEAWTDALIAAEMDNWEIYYLKGLALKNQGHPKKALIELETALEKSDNEEEICIARAEIYTELGNETEALACFARPNLSAEALRSKGDTELKFKRYADAIESYKKCLKNNSHNQSAWYGKGMAHLGSKELDDAIECFDTAIGIDSDYVWAWAGKAKAYLLKGDEKKAGQAKAIALELDSDFVFS